MAKKQISLILKNIIYLIKDNYLKTAISQKIMERTFIFLVIGLSLVLAGCGQPKLATNQNQNITPPPPLASSQNISVTIQNFSFTPADIKVKVGDKVTWTNQDSVSHTVTAAGFDSGILNQGQSFSQTFNETGEFNYHCSPHQSMKGTVTVE